MHVKYISAYKCVLNITQKTLVSDVSSIKKKKIHDSLLW